jgi:hypothetical protein
MTDEGFSIKSFCGGSRGAVFSKRTPLVAEGKKTKFHLLVIKQPGLVFFLKSLYHWCFPWVANLKSLDFQKIVTPCNNGSKNSLSSC